jgi:hypothetical protein
MNMPIAHPPVKNKCASTCMPCDVPELCRNAFFTGKLLTERDFTMEQQYFIDKLRLHHLALHGWGIACGLTVTPHPYCPQLRIYIEPGLAIDGCGREIWVCERIEWELPKFDTKQPPGKDPCPPEPTEPPPYGGERPPYGQEPPRYGQEPPPSGQKPPLYDQKPPPSGQKPPTHGQEPPPYGQESPPYGQKPPPYGQEPPPYGQKPPPYGQEPPPYGQEPPPSDYTPDRHDPYGDEPEPCVPRTDLYLSLCYDECETELVPAPFDECACGGITKHASRICQTYCIEWSTTRPKDWPTQEECGCDDEEDEDCALLYDRIRKPCPVPAKTRCVPLVVIRGYETGKPVMAEMLDYSDRRDLASTRLLDLLIRCILKKLPAKQYTQICDINWEHGLHYTCRQFQQLFVGDAQSNAAIEITFSNPVRTETLSTRSFQAIVVQHSRERREGGYMEVAPAKVWASADRRKFYLRIEPGYAQHCLERGSFDLFVILRCNVIVDDRGRPVDGTLLARQEDNDVIVGPPTGDGIAGGTFESWFRVRD